MDFWILFYLLMMGLAGYRLGILSREKVDDCPTSEPKLGTAPNGSVYLYHGEDPDGRFLLIPRSREDSRRAQLEATMPTRIRLVHNWFTELEEKVAGNQ